MYLKLDFLEVKMTHTELHWKSRDGLGFYALEWPIDVKPKGIICLVHGYGEHINRYHHVAAAFNEAGYAMLGFDLRGHGQSEGPRGHTPSYDQLMDDIADLLIQAEKRHPGIPKFIYGHSMGGNLAINYVLRRKSDLAGAIITGPWLKLAFQPPTSQVILARIMNSIAPGFTQTSALNAGNLSHDPEIVKAYETDPLVHGHISARLFLSIYESGLWALDHAAELSIPMLLMHGAVDPITSAEASREFAKKAGQKVNFIPWENLYHEIHNELNKSEVLQSMTSWLAKQITG
jgi:alpha-beta hydrolase superfamily lysophospholipase